MPTSKIGEMPRNDASTQLKQGLTTQILHSQRQRGIRYEHGAAHAPIHPSISFAYDDAADVIDVFQGRKSGYRYSRQGNPTVTELEQKISDLEGGTGSVSFATGMAAIAAVFLTFLQRGDHVIASQFLFGNTHSLFNTLSKQGIEVTQVDVTQLANIERVAQPNTRLVFVETIANPRTQIPDLAAIGQWCVARNCLYVVDNTLTSPASFLPKTVGASLVVNSLTKYLSGHGDVLGGVVTDTGRFDWQLWHDRMNVSILKLVPEKRGMSLLRSRGLRDFGASLSADAAHHVMVGMETLELRYSRICESAAALTLMLSQHPAVASVYHPSLSSHPQHQIARQHFRFFGGLFSFELLADSELVSLLNSLKLPLIATHLGDNRTLVLPVAQTIFCDFSDAERQTMGIANGLIRVSVGIENTADLLADFSSALSAL